MTDEVHTTSAFHPLTSVAEAVCVVGDTIRAVTASAGKHPGLLWGPFKRTTPSGRLSLKFHCLFVYRQVLSMQPRLALNTQCWDYKHVPLWPLNSPFFK